VTDEGLLVRFEDDTTAADAQVVLATGLNPVPEHPLVGSVAESLSLERGRAAFSSSTTGCSRGEGSMIAVLRCTFRERS
jgi:hypothetical protein